MQLNNDLRKVKEGSVKMRKRKRKVLSSMAFSLVFLLVFQLFTPAAYGENGTEVYSVIENTEITALQNEEETIGDVSVNNAQEETGLPVTQGDEEITTDGPEINGGQTNIVGTESQNAEESAVDGAEVYGMLEKPQTTEVADGAEVKNILTNIKATVLQNNEEIVAGGTLDSNKPIKIIYSFDLPVQNDYPEPSEFVKSGDIATFVLPDKLELINTASQSLMFQGEVVGDVTFSGSQAVVTFSELLNDESIMCVSSKFEAEMNYDASGAPEEGGEYDIVILDKTFKVIVPPKQVTITGEKKGTVDVTNKIVKWMVEVTASLEGGGDGSLRGYTFSDDLGEVGGYVPNSFKIGKSNDETEANLVSVDYEDKTLTYAFPDGYRGTYYLFFQTEIPDSMIYATGKQSIYNSAVIKKDNEVKLLTDTVEFQMEWIKKNGEVVSGSEGSDVSYDPSARKIRWTIQANQMGATIDNAVITDVLPEGLTFEKASIAYRAVGESSWGTETLANPEIVDQKLTFSFGNELTGKEVLIKIETKVDDTSQSSDIKNFENYATLTGDGLPGNGFDSNHYSVGIGINPISKSAENYDNATHKLNWTVAVNTKSQQYGGNLRVMDLLVYGSNFNVLDFSGLNTGNDLKDITYSDLEKMTPQFNQKYAGNFNGTGLDIAVHHLKKDGKVVADILIVTKEGGTGLDYTKINTFSYDTVVINPDIYASNQSSEISNTATLFSSNLKLNSATGKKSITSNMLKKDMLTRENAAGFEGDLNALLNINGDPAGTDGGFRYDDKSVIFRIHVNTNGLADATNDLTTADGEKLGNLVVTDTLPRGWEFKKLDGKDFLIYEKNGNPLHAVVPQISDYSDFLSTTGPTEPIDDVGGTMTFQFNKLTKPYVILVKAGPTAQMAENYFSKNDHYSVDNNVTMSNEHYTSNKAPKSKQTVSIESNVLNKKYGSPEKGTLLWTVEYKPYHLKHDGAYIEDILPIGLDLPLDAKGNLILEDNIKILKLEMAANGSYSDGDIVPFLPNQEMITYHNASRTLRFNLPDTQQAYRLTYKTDITGDPGATMTNKVTLYAKEVSNEEQNKQYIISDVDASASFLRGGWIKITKTNQSSLPLPGADFTLFAEDGFTVIRKGTSGIDGIIHLKGITPGKYILKETKSPDGYNISAETYVVSIVKGEDNKITTTINNTNTNAITVKNILTGTVGDLKISKTVAGNAGDKVKSFTFTIAFTGTDDVFSYSKSGSPNGTIKSGDIITLTHGQEITIMGIPKGVSYTVTENDYSAEGYKTEKSGDTGTIVADETKNVSFTNTKTKKDSGGGGTTPRTKSGSVKIIKVDSENTSKTLSGAVFELLNNKNEVVETSITDTDGVVRFEELDLDVTYTVREKKAPAGYEVSDKDYSLRLSEDTGKRNITIEFKNDKVEKEIPPVDPEEPTESGDTPKPKETYGDIPKEPDKKEDKGLQNINSDGTSTSGRHLGDDSVALSDLDDTPKTGVNMAAKKIVVALIILSGSGLFLIKMLKKRKVEF